MESAFEGAARDLTKAMETSVEIKFLLGVAAAVVLSAFALSWFAGNKGDQLIAWVKLTFPEHWNGLPKVQRNWLRNGAIENLRRNALRDDAEFLRRYNQIKRLRGWEIRLIAAGAAVIGLIFIGTQFDGWSW